MTERSEFAEAALKAGLLGFKILRVRDFVGREGVDHIWYLWSDDGIFCVLESYYGGRGINRAQIWYNIRFDAERFCYVMDDDDNLVLAGPGERGHWDKDGVSRSRYTSSGYFVDYDDDPTWIGDSDVRWGFESTVKGLRGAGEFMTEWKESWLAPNVRPYTEERHEKGVTEMDREEFQAAIVADRDYFAAEVPGPVGKMITEAIDKRLYDE